MNKEELNIIFKDDLKQYKEILDAYDKLDTVDIDLAYDMAKTCLLLSDRWNEIMLSSSKYCLMLDTSKTTFEKWAYHKYRILMTMHEFCRVVWRQGKEEYKNNFNNEM